MINAYGGDLYTWLNDGTGSFTGTDGFEGYGSPIYAGYNYGDGPMALGDVNGDGILDIVTGGTFYFGNQYGGVLLGDGTGSFYASGYSVPSYGSYIESVALGDIDGDGDLDAVVSGSYGTRVWTNNGYGSFGDTGQSFDVPGYGTYGGDVQLADVNGDGHLDVILTSRYNYFGSTYGETSVWLNDGSGSFGFSGITFGGSYAFATSVGDVNGDGIADVFVARHGEYVDSPESDQVWFGTAAGTFTQHPTMILGAGYGSSYAYNVQAIDVNGDGSLDIVVTGDYNYSNGTMGHSVVWLNDGNGHFTQSDITFGGAYGFDAALGELDHPEQLLTESGTLTVSTADLLANDTDVDNGASLTVVSVDTHGLTGTATFTAGQIVYDTNGQFESLAQGETAIDTFTYTMTDEHGATSVATGSIVVHGENDAPTAHDDIIGLTGSPDLFVAETHNSTWGASDQVWLNQGNGQFSFHESTATFATNDVALGDMDGDGHLDAVVTGYRYVSYGTFGNYVTENSDSDQRRHRQLQRQWHHAVGRRLSGGLGRHQRRRPPRHPGVARRLRRRRLHEQRLGHELQRGDLRRFREHQPYRGRRHQRR